MEYKMFLIKYAEIGTKGKNRYVFEDILCKRMRSRLKRFGSFEIKRDYGRIFVEARSEYDFDDVVATLQQIFGIVGICPVTVVESLEYDEIAKGVVESIDKEYDDRDFTFKVNVRRNNKEFPITSMDMNAKLGGELLAKFEDEGLSVDVHKPEITVNVEIRKIVYIYSKVIPGPGGLPVGTNGKAVSLLSGGIDSPVASYMIAKRGVEIEAVYFHSPPHTSERAKEKVKELGRIVSQYSGVMKLHIVNFTDIQLAIYDKCPHDELTIIMKRIMFKLAEDIAKRDDCQCIVSGESIGQVSSQTTFSLGVINEAVDEIPIFRPCIGMDKQEIVDLSLKIGTYETSCLPYEDCCTIFVAKHPVTKPTLEQIKKSEEKLKGVIEPLYKEALDTMEIVYLR